MEEKHKKCKRINQRGDAHFLTFTCFKRQAFLIKDRSKHWFLESLSSARQKHNFHLWAYVIMPEHVHLLIWPTTAEYSISKILSSIKLPVTQKAIKYLQEYAPSYMDKMLDLQPNGNLSYRFWQRGGGYDGNLDQPKTIWETIDYIHNNPLRRRLCDNVLDYPWSSAVETYKPGSGLLKLDLESLPRTEQG